jgi:hypothetical protein
MTLRWLVVRTLGNHESIAFAAIKERGYDPLLPMCWTERTGGRPTRGGAPVKMPAPLYPGYLFAGHEEGQDLYPLRKAHGVIGILLAMNGAGPAYLPAAFVADLTARLTHASGVLALDDGLTKIYRPNERLTITGGPLDGYSGLYQRSAKGRVELLMGLARLWVAGSSVEARPTRA